MSQKIQMFGRYQMSAHVYLLKVNEMPPTSSDYYERCPTERIMPKVNACLSPTGDQHYTGRWSNNNSDKTRHRQTLVSGNILKTAQFFFKKRWFPTCDLCWKHATSNLHCYHILVGKKTLMIAFRACKCQQTFIFPTRTKQSNVASNCFVSDGN